MANHNIKGKQGENEAALYLIANNYTVIAKNYRYKRNEIDLIAQKNNLLIFVEVKTRSSTSFGPPESFLSVEQMARISAAAKHYLEEVNHTDEIRFDIISVSSDLGLQHIKDAYFLTGE